MLAHDFTAYVLGQSIQVVLIYAIVVGLGLSSLSIDGILCLTCSGTPLLLLFLTCWLLILLCSSGGDCCQVRGELIS